MLSNRLQSLGLNALDVDATGVADVVSHDGRGGALVPAFVGQGAECPPQGIEASIRNASRGAQFAKGDSYPIVMTSIVHDPGAAVRVQEHQFAAVGLLEQGDVCFFPKRNGSLYPRLASRESDNPIFGVMGGAGQAREVGITHSPVESQEDHGLELAVGLAEQGGYLERRIQQFPPLGLVAPEFGLGGAAEVRSEVWYFVDEPTFEGPFERPADQIDHLLPPRGAESLYGSSEGQEVTAVGGIRPHVSNDRNQPRADIDIIPNRSQAAIAGVCRLALAGDDELEHILHGHLARELGGLAKLLELFFEYLVGQFAGWGLFVAANPADNAGYASIPAAIASSHVVFGGSFGHGSSKGVV